MTEQPILALQGLTKSYPDFQLGPIDLELEPGRVLAFIGPNGAGKTTTLHAIMNLLRCDGGEVRVLGRRNDAEDPIWKQEVGFVGEVQGFYKSWSVDRNLRFLSRFYTRWDQGYAENLARRLDLDLKKKVRALSRGNRAKLALVAALSYGPRLLLLDEPSNGLDPVVRSELLDVLWEFLEDSERAILYSTHVLSDISRLADELLFLRDGQLVQRTAKEDLTESWRRISFRLDGEALMEVQAARGIRRRGREYQLVTSDHEVTERHVRALGAEGLEVTRMTIDEIAVEILKEGHRVAAP